MRFSEYLQGADAISSDQPASDIVFGLARLGRPVSIHAPRAGGDIDTERLNYLYERVLPDLAFLFEGLGENVEASLDSLLDSDDAMPSGLWDPEAGSVEGGVNYSEEPDGSDDPRTSSAEPAG
jgi:hypothetical protein